MSLSLIFHLGKIESNSSEISRITLEQSYVYKREIDQNKLFCCNYFQIIPIWTFCSGKNVIVLRIILVIFFRQARPNALISEFTNLRRSNGLNVSSMTQRFGCQITDLILKLHSGN